MFFAEVPDALTWIGAGIVFSASFYIVWREAKLRRLQAQAARPETE
jgi:drug/metabolite transporter (DMT)-like permease